MAARLKLPKVYPITDDQISGISTTEQVKRLICGGATIIQIRAKHATSRELFNNTRDAIEIAQASGALIIVNDRVDIALATKAHGVHLGQADFPAKHARSILGAGAIIGVSTHTPEQAKEAASMPIDYVAIGPIFHTSTKSDTSAPIGLRGIAAIKSIIGGLPLVAIGGINETNIREVLEAGADSAAVISAVFSDSGRIAENLKVLMTS